MNYPPVPGFYALQTLFANNHANSRTLADSEIAGIRICEPAGRRRSQGRAMRKSKKYAALGEMPALLAAAAGPLQRLFHPPDKNFLGLEPGCAEIRHFLSVRL
jgi:hypothetical protein